MGIRAFANLGTSIAAKSWCASFAIHATAFAAVVGWSRFAESPPLLLAHAGQSALVASIADPNPGNPTDEPIEGEPKVVLEMATEVPEPELIAIAPVAEAPTTPADSLEMPRLETPTEDILAVLTPPATETPTEDAAKPDDPPADKPPTPTDEAQEVAPPGDETPTTSAPSPGRMGNDQPTEPGFESNPPILYPPAALRDHVEGTVLLRVRIGTSGRVIDVQLVKSSGSTILDDAALESVRTWHGRPAQIGGYAVEASALLPVVFRIN